QPPKRRDADGEIVTRSKLDSGETAITHFGMMYGDEPDTRVTLLGPSSEVLSPRGAQVSSMSFGCGNEYQIVAREADAFVMLHDPPGLGGPIRGYDPHDTERWYTDRARCDRDAEARAKPTIAGIVEPHRGC